MRTDTRTDAGGAICPLCCHYGQPHTCITNPQHDGLVLSLTPLDDPLISRLLAHPAQPITITDGVVTLRTVHRSWCFCQCSAVMRAPTGHDGRPSEARP